jgi:hypothetical protein
MNSEFLNTEEAAYELGINVLTLYDWLNQSNVGEFRIRGAQVCIEYFQGGAKGQGRIRIRRGEVKRLLDLMRVHPKSTPARRSPQPKRGLQHITSKLGRPDD